MSWDLVGSGGILHCPRYCHCVLDYIWYQIHGWGMVLATSVPPTDGSQFCSRGRSDSASILSQMACEQGTRRRCPAKPMQAATAIFIGYADSARTHGDSGGSTIPSGDERRKTSRPTEWRSKKFSPLGTRLVDGLLQEELLAKNPRRSHDHVLPASRYP